MDMKKLAENLPSIIESLLLLLVFGLIFLTMTQTPTYFVIIVNFVVTLLLFVFLTVRGRLRTKRIVQRMSDEISTLPRDLTEKTYDGLPTDTQIFYDALSRVKQLLRKRDQTRQEILDIANAVAVNMEFSQLLHDLLPKLCDATRSQCCAFYTANYSTNKLELKHSVGFSKNIYAEFDLTLGEGFVGQATASGKTTVYRDIPEDTVYIVRTFLGKIKPRNVMIVPILFQEQLNGTLVCASIYEYNSEDREMVELIKYYLGVAVGNGMNYEKTKRLTNELTFQNKLIQDQHEEMQKKLHDKTQLFNGLINLIDDSCLFAMDLKGIILFWNKGAERIHGITGEEAIGRNIDWVFEQLEWPLIGPSLQYAIKNGAHEESAWRNTVSGGKQYYEIKLFCVYSEQNEPIGVLSRVREIDEQTD